LSSSQGKKEGFFQGTGVPLSYFLEGFQNTFAVSKTNGACFPPRGFLQQKQFSPGQQVFPNLLRGEHFCALPTPFSNSGGIPQKSPPRNISRHTRLRKQGGALHPGGAPHQPPHSSVGGENHPSIEGKSSSVRGGHTLSANTPPSGGVPAQPQHVSPPPPAKSQYVVAPSLFFFF